ncbi:MAG TPA: LysR substrate-binding domain-containing protein [Sphingomonas sp.]|nr:LysR substrate-binding domain-containing protein [Sphingomonas sp.]
MIKPFDLNLRHLRALSAVIAEGSLSQAAEVTGLSQPALTQGLAKLERRLEVQLFDRRTDGVLPTQAGQVLAERTTRALACLAGGVRRVGRRNRGFARPAQLMTATQLSAFLQFSAVQSFSGAAAATGLSQAAIHRAVRDLQQICGVQLVERRGRGVTLTTAGRALARGARLAEQEIAAGIMEARGDDRGSGRISIGAMPFCRALLLPRALAELLRIAPHTVVDVIEGSWRELIEPLADGVVDVTIGALREEAPTGIEQEPLFTDRLAIFGRPGHPALAGGASLELLRGQPWIVGPVGTPLRAHWEAMFGGGALPNVPIECGSVMVIRGLLAQSDLLTLLSPDQVALEVQSGMLVQIPPPVPAADRVIGLTVRSGWRPTHVQREFLRLIRLAALETRLQENQ